MGGSGKDCDWDWERWLPTPPLANFQLSPSHRTCSFSLSQFQLPPTPSLPSILPPFKDRCPPFLPPPILLLFHFTNILYPYIPDTLSSPFAILFLIQATTCYFPNTSTTSTYCWTQRIPLYIQDYLSQRTPRIVLCSCQDCFFAVNINSPGPDNNLVIV